MNISAYESADITAWMGRVVGDGTITATVEESTDGVVWSTCGGSSSLGLSELTEALLSPEFAKAWMRLVIEIVSGVGDNPIATFWAVGFAKKRHK